jgi:3-deoxy-D-manno-octulosonic-acid transferase
MMSLVLDFVYLFAFALASPWILYRLVTNRGRSVVLQRLGIGLPTLSDRCLWLHGSSVGEVGLLKPLIALLEREMPQIPLVISSHTQTGFAAALTAYPQHCVVVFPLDFSFIVRRFLRRLRPRLVIIAESELWPNFLLVTRRHAIPAAVVNGKMSAKSFNFYRRTRFIASAIRAFRVLAVQSEEHAVRFRALGVPADAIRVTGNMKYDFAAPPVSKAGRSELREALGYTPDDVLVVGGSLHVGEDTALLQAIAASSVKATAALMLVPRYPADAHAVAQHVLEAGFTPVLKSDVDCGAQLPPGRGGVLVVDTVGQLGGLYAAADVDFVGGSLYYRGANKGGHNLMEPAAHGLPVLFGTHNYSFKDTVEDLLAARAGILVRNETELTDALVRVVTDRVEREAIGARARAVVLRGQGATARNYALIAELLGEREACLQPPSTNRTMPQATSDLDQV